ncbi:MAG: hypothetical protein WC529_04590 [Candidatus Margulisiibacteriota bacterium]
MNRKLGFLALVVLVALLCLPLILDILGCASVSDTPTTTTPGSSTTTTTIVISKYTLVASWGASGTGNGQFSTPKGIAIDAGGNIYVTDSGLNRVQKFDSSGNFLTKWGVSGTGESQFSAPAGIAFGLSGEVYIADDGNNRIQYFNTSGSYLGQWGRYGTQEGNLWRPTGVAVSPSGEVFVADLNNKRVQVFSDSGSFSRKWALTDPVLGALGPYDIAVTAANQVFVSVPSIKTYKYTTDGTYQASLEGRTTPAADPGLGVDAAGNVFVVGSYMYYRVDKFSSSGSFLTEIGTRAAGASDFEGFLYDAAVDSAGNVYVLDNGSSIGKVKKFSPGP